MHMRSAQDVHNADDMVINLSVRPDGGRAGLGSHSARSAAQLSASGTVVGGHHRENISMRSSANEASASFRAKPPVKGRWTNEEHQSFIDSLRLYGKDWYRVEEAIGTRSSA